MINQPRMRVRITHIDWRGGRPRFKPGPGLRALGYASRDLKHPDGTWFNHDEAFAESERIHAEAQSRRAARAAGQRLKRPAASSAGLTLGELSDALFDLPVFAREKIVDRKREEKGLARKTVAGYRKSAAAVQAACTRLAVARNAPSLWLVPARAILPKAAQALLDEIHAHSGLHQARACRAFLSQLWSRAGELNNPLSVNVWQQLKKLETPKGRLHPWEPEEFWHMLATADAMGRPEMADSFLLGALHGHRQTDRITLTGLGQVAGASHLTATQSKTGRTVVLRLGPLLQGRLAAAVARRARQQVSYPHLVIDETANTPWHPEGDHYRHVFAEVRAVAARSLPSCASLRDQDLRDTNQTWLDRAGTDPEIMALVAGHSAPRTLTAIQRRHYVAFNQHRADAAVDAITAYLMKHQPAAAQEGTL